MILGKKTVGLWMVLLTGSLALSCGDDDDDSGGNEALLAELESTGIAKYLGAYQPATAEIIDDYTQYEFDPADGVHCIRGSEFRAATLDRPSNDLLLYLQGGGACWSTLCTAIEDAGAGIPRGGILSDTLSDNPVKDWDIAYVPYCDGSLFAGDTTIDDDGDGVIDRYHYGLRCLSAALDVTKKDFPDPDRILLTGTSAGAYGTIIAAMLVRYVYPNTKIDIVADAGVGLGKASDKGFVSGLLTEWGAMKLIPPSCVDCMANGHVTGLIEWGLANDPDIRIAAISSYGDAIIGTMFLGLGPDDYKTALVDETGRLASLYPGRYHRFLFNGTLHTTIGFDSSVDLSGDASFGGISGDSRRNIIGSFDEIEVDGANVAQWLGWMVAGDERWGDRLE